MTSPVSPSGRTDQARSHISRRAIAGVSANSRLTGSTAAVLLVLLAAEGVTILQVRALLTAHVFIGMVIIPPVLVKIGSTGYRFTRYYTGSPAYRRKGPPAPLLRLLGPVVVVLTLVVLASGVALLLTGASVRSELLTIHKASFILWFGAMAIHVLAHLKDTARLAPRDWYARTRGDVAGAGLRQWTVAASLAVGLLLGVVFAAKVGTYIAR